MRSQIFTAHDSVIYIDGTNRRLRHGPFQRSEANVFVSDSGAVLGEPAVSGAVALDDGAILDLSVHRFAKSGREFVLAVGDAWLSALPGGGFALAPHQREWERFHARPGYSEQTGNLYSRLVEGTKISFFAENHWDWIAQAQRRYGFFELELLEDIRRHMPEGKTFVDVGANVGNHTIFMSRLSTVRAIIPFEANPKAVELLRINLALNRCTNVDGQHLGTALGSRSMRLRVEIPTEQNLGGAFLVADANGAIQSSPGDSLIAHEPVGLMKIDVEGMEFEVLEGLALTVSRWRPLIVIEVFPASRERLESWCAGNSYEISTEYGHDNFMLAPLTA